MFQFTGIADFKNSHFSHLLSRKKGDFSSRGVCCPSFQSLLLLLRMTFLMQESFKVACLMVSSWWLSKMLFACSHLYYCWFAKTKIELFGDYSHFSFPISSHPPAPHWFVLKTICKLACCEKEKVFSLLACVCKHVFVCLTNCLFACLFVCFKWSSLGEAKLIVGLVRQPKNSDCVFVWLKLGRRKTLVESSNKSQIESSAKLRKLFQISGSASSENSK